MEGAVNLSKIPLIILTGPTAVGKTDLSINISKRLNCEIISADSMQVYKYMDVGTAKITNDEMQGVKHYLIDEVEPDFEFSVAEFQQRSKKYIKEIYQKDKLPLITGGTGLYLNSLIYNMDFAKSNADSEIRENLTNEAKEFGPIYMHNKLKELDLQAASRIHPNNTKRVIRALEVCYQGKQMDDFSLDLKYNSEYKPIIIVLNRDRQHLYDRINRRVDIMMENGLVDEVKKLLSMGYTKDMVSMQGIGYKEIIRYLDGEYSLNEAIEIVKRDSRRYAKRQITWFKRYEEAKWFNLDEYEDLQKLETDILSYIENAKEIM